MVPVLCVTEPVPLALSVTVELAVEPSRLALRLILPLVPVCRVTLALAVKVLPKVIDPLVAVSVRNTLAPVDGAEMFRLVASLT